MNSLEWLVEASFALKFCHDREFTHGSLSPSAFLVGPDQRLKVGDFGLNKLLNISKADEVSQMKRGLLEALKFTPIVVDYHFDIVMLGVMFVLITNLRPSFAALTTSDLMPQLDEGVVRLSDRTYSRELNNFINFLVSAGANKLIDINAVCRSQYFLKLLAEHEELEANQRMSASGSERTVKIAVDLGYEGPQGLLSTPSSAEKYVETKVKNEALKNNRDPKQSSGQKGSRRAVITSDFVAHESTSKSNPFNTTEDVCNRETNTENKANLNDQKASKSSGGLKSKKNSRTIVESKTKSTGNIILNLRPGKNFSFGTRLNHPSDPKKPARDLAFRFDPGFTHTKSSNKLKSVAHPLKPPTEKKTEKVVSFNKRSLFLATDRPRPSDLAKHSTPSNWHLKSTHIRIPAVQSQTSQTNILKRSYMPPKLTESGPRPKESVRMPVFMSKSSSVNSFKGEPPKMPVPKRSYIFKAPQQRPSLNLGPSKKPSSLKLPSTTRLMEKKQNLEIDFVIDDRIRREIGQELTEEEFETYMQNAKKIIFNKGLSLVEKSVGSLRKVLELGYSVDPNLEILKTRPHLLPDFITLTIQVIRANTFW